jgi:hypothetical protein
MGCEYHPFLSSLLETSGASLVTQLCLQKMGAEQGHCQVNKTMLIEPEKKKKKKKTAVDQTK